MTAATAPKTILLVEDDPSLTLGLVDALEFEGFRVLHAARGAEAIEQARKQAPDCIILDLMLPDLNGYQVCEQIRRSDARTPILMLTARSQEADKIRGLDAGADDYVTKPFSVGELVARLRAILRRTARDTSGDLPFAIGDCTIDPVAHTLTRAGVSEPLSFYEAELLKLLFERKGQPVSRDDILRRVWGIDANPTNRTVDNFVVKLRKKIEVEPAQPRHILTVYGLGYKLVP
jgi:DNA-binding response OmpR family regulator